MMAKLAPVILLFILPSVVFSQSTDNAPRKGRPDIPGAFSLELGVSRLTETPNDIDYGFWGSRTFNVYFQPDIRIGKTKFSFHPGIGIGMDRFKFMGFKEYFPTDTIERRAATLMFDNEGNTRFVEALNYIYDDDSLGQVNWSDTYATHKSMLALNYIDVPVEFRFSTNPDDPSRSFKVALGGRVGYLVNSHTKLKYKEDGDLKTLKNKQDFNLSPIRYGAYMKIFIGNFSFFGVYNINPMFREGKGPAETKTSYYTVGISVSGF